MNPLPRKSMREPACRRMEPDIARACHESFVVEPWLLRPPKKADTYIQLFYDARRAFRNNMYESELIPLNVDTMAIRLAEQADGTVLVTRPPSKVRSTRNVLTLYASDEVACVEIADKLHKRVLDGLRCSVTITINNDEEREFVASLTRGRDVAIEEIDKRTVRIY